MQLQVDFVKKTFPFFEKGGQVTALGKMQFVANPGEFLCILGASGCGKTTLLNIIAGLDSHFDGKVSLIGNNSEGCVPRIGYVFQNPRLLPWRTVEENLQLVLSPKQIHSGIIEELLVSTELEAFRKTYPPQLSIGMQRRVALVRAFSIQPDLLVMDEPFVSLDKPMADFLRGLLLDYWQDRKPIVLFVTHQLAEAFQLAGRLLVFSSRPGTLILDVPVSVPYGKRKYQNKYKEFVKQLSNEYPLLLDMI